MTKEAAAEKLCDSVSQGLMHAFIVFPPRLITGLQLYCKLGHMQRLVQYWLNWETMQGIHC